MRERPERRDARPENEGAAGSPDAEGAGGGAVQQGGSRPSTGPTGRAGLLVLRIGAALTALLALAQPFLAGGFLQGYYPLLQAHAVAAMILASAALVALIGGVLVWRPGGGPSRPAVQYAVLAVAIVVQIMLGYSRVLLLHIPLGVGIFVMAEKFVTDAFRLKPRGAAGDSATQGGGQGGVPAGRAEQDADGAGGPGAVPKIGKARAGDSEVTA
jgi:hypothetical protein